MSKIKKALPFALPPLAVAVLLLVIFKLEGLYPFGTGSVSWCDMNQQVVPLLINLKDILDGKGSLFLNVYNAGGMNFYGIFFFFLASPFSFLVKFVHKTDVILFANVLVILKLMTVSFTAMFYFRKCRKNLDWQAAALLSVMYAFCGYAMLFYQNIIWLDMMYLFPLLLWSLDKLVKTQKNLPYIIMVSLMLVVNYYISYMVVLFILLFMTVYVLRNYKEKKTPLLCTRFFSGSFIAALLTAVVWLPCLKQYLTSGRGKSIGVTLASASFITPYKSLFPLFFCSAFILVVVGYNIIIGTKRSKNMNTNMLMFLLMLIPCLIEPINIMWHTGNYMAFSGRYVFITIFLGLVCCADFLELDKDESKKIKLNKSYPSFFCGAFVVAAYFMITKKLIGENLKELSNYTSTLGGNDDSFEGLFQLFIIAALCYGIVYFLYKKGKLAQSLFTILLCGLVAIESAGNVKIYMTSFHNKNPKSAIDYRETLGIADKIDDDSFYRVATKNKIMDYNLVGALGYPSLSHYTSLTNQGFMFTQKRLGYNSVWMEVGSFGGTELTDALYSVKYKIVPTTTKSEKIFEGTAKSIVKSDYTIGWGLITNSDLSACSEIPEGLTRAQIQSYLATTLFNEENLITEQNYVPTSFGVKYKDGKYSFERGGTISYNFHVKGRQSLYFDCFDNLSNNLSEEYFSSFAINVNNSPIDSDYPKSLNNGLLNLGEYEDEMVEIEITCKKKISCYSFGVFSLDRDLMQQITDNAQSVNFIENAGTITGSCTAQSGDKCLLTLPYDDGFTVKINGEKVDYSRAYSDFIAFDLNAGSNDIKITFVPQGFYCGLGITLGGAALLVAYIVFGKKLKLSKKLNFMAQSVVMFLSLALIGLVYILPVVISITSVPTK